MGKFSLGNLIGDIPVAGGVLKGAYDSTIGGLGDAYDDYMGVGKTHFSEPGYTESPVYWGGNQNAASNFAQMGLDNLSYGQRMQDYAMGQTAAERGPQAIENQDLSDREAMTKYMDQDRALNQLGGMAGGQGSGAGGYIQMGANAAKDMQQSLAGGARGNAALAVAQQNAAANAANMQANAAVQAQTAADQFATQNAATYANAVGTARSQDQNRLQIGNQMSQYNAGLNDQYRLGMGNLANNYGANQAQWYQAAQNPYNQQAQLANNTAGRASENYNRYQDRAAGIATGNAAARADQTNGLYTAGGQLFGSAMGGVKGT